MPAPTRAAATILGLLLAGPLAAGIDAGSYLSARAALQAGDFATAAPYLTRTLADDPDNPDLLESTIIAQLGRGAFDAAVPAADHMLATGARSARAAMVATAAAVRAGAWDDILDALDAGRRISPLADALSRAWALAGAGDMQAALAAFDVMAAAPGMRAVALQHKALALALAGDFEGAGAILSLPPGEGPVPTQSVIAMQAQVLSQLGEGDAAITLLDRALAQMDDPVLADQRARLAAGETLPFTGIRSAADGMAEAWFTIAGALVNGGADLDVLLNARLALAMNPRHVGAQFLVAQILERMEQYDAARIAYAAIPEGHPLRVAAELGEADVLRRMDDSDAAITVLQGLLADNPDLGPAVQRLGDALRASGREAEAVAAYSRALDLAGADSPGRWRILYARAVTSFGLGDWDAAEADFRAAIALQPQEASLLNYYGYSLVDRGEKLDEALDLIERAVALEPRNGAYVDSLGWAWFRLGRFDDAVARLEQAATLEATDAVVNDHLGDAYWMVGRLREARFQWQRALSFGPDPDEADAIRRKLESGLALDPQPEPGADG
ncbi:MAG: tetratricopeptide repeat protein [Rubellimicrobium sp.]|nr:tetratricopeptide repeat protein [Rubellimicrobium sp.]